MEGMMASGKKPEIVAGMDNPVTNDHKQHKTVTRFREVLPQVNNHLSDRFAICIAQTKFKN